MTIPVEAAEDAAGRLMLELIGQPSGSGLANGLMLLVVDARQPVDAAVGGDGHPHQLPSQELGPTKSEEFSVFCLSHLPEANFNHQKS